MSEGDWEERADTYLDIEYRDPVEKDIEAQRRRAEERARRLVNPHTGVPSRVKFRESAMLIAQCIFEGASNSEEIARITGISRRKVIRYRQIWAKYIETLIEGLWFEHNKVIAEEVKAARQKTIKHMVNLREKADATVGAVMDQAADNPAAALKAAEYVHGLLGIHDEDQQEAPRSRTQIEQQRLLNDSLGLVSKIIGRPIEKLPSSTENVIEVEVEVIKP